MGENAEIDILDRLYLTVGSSIDGPAIIEQADTTTVLHVGWTATVIQSGELILKKRVTP
jgi:N-methylhydantoinase A